MSYPVYFSITLNVYKWVRKKIVFKLFIKKLYPIKTSLYLTCVVKTACDCFCRLINTVWLPYSVSFPFCKGIPPTPNHWEKIDSSTSIEICDVKWPELFYCLHTVLCTCQTSSLTVWSVLRKYVIGAFAKTHEAFTFPSMQLMSWPLLVYLVAMEVKILFLSRELAMFH